MKKSFQSAFTLIELLIVIAIIGILAAVILSALNDAKEQGIEAKIQAEMDSIAKRAAIEESQSFSYDTVCGSGGFATSTKIMELIASIEALASSTVTCNSNTIEYAASVATESAHWCVDSLGTRREISAALGPAVRSCPP